MGGKRTKEITPSFIEVIESRLKGILPGASSQMKMRPHIREIQSFVNFEKDAMPAAVLFLLFQKSSQWGFFLTQRSKNVEYHRGQISLPGGCQEQNESLNDTALRETEEEIGVPVSAIKTLGSVTPLFIPASGFIVTPFIGYCKNHVIPNIDKNEVESLHCVKVEHLLDDLIIENERKVINAVEVEIPFFNFNGLKVWGATASILNECKEIISDCYKKE